MHAIGDRAVGVALQAHLPRLRGLTMSAERLVQIRQTRYPNSRYTSLEQCRTELAAASRLFSRHHIPVIEARACRWKKSRRVYDTRLIFALLDKRRYRAAPDARHTGTMPGSSAVAR